MEQIGTGDWIGLTEAAAMLCEGRQSQKSADDIVKAGYLTYEGVKNRLKIYTFARTTISVVPYEPEWMDEADKLAGAEKLLAFRAYLPGDLFELHPDILERILLLRTFPTSAHIPCAVIRREGTDSVDGIIRPDIEIRWEDLRVDRVELLEFVDEVRRAFEAYGGAAETQCAANDELHSGAGENLTEMKRSGIIKKFRDEWPNAENDFGNMSRNGLRAAGVKGKRGFFYVEKATKWAKTNGKLIERNVHSPSVFNSPVSKVHKLK